MLTIDEAKSVLSLHERDGYLYEYRTVENLDYNRCRHTEESHTEELFVHSATAFISHLAEKAASAGNDTHLRRAEAWKVVHEWVRSRENSHEL